MSRTPHHSMAVRLACSYCDAELPPATALVACVDCARAWRTLTPEERWGVRVTVAIKLAAFVGLLLVILLLCEQLYFIGL